MPAVVSSFDLIDLVHSLHNNSQENPRAPIERWLLDPADLQREIFNRLQETLRDAWTTSRPFIAAVTATAVLLSVVTWLLRSRAWRRARASARWVQVIPPIATDTADGQTMWRQLTGLLRPGALGPRMRLLTWELHAAHEQVHAGLWVPGSINPDHVANAVTGAYPRARATYGKPGPDPGPLLPQPWPVPPTLWWRLRRWMAERRGRPAPRRRPAAVGYLLVPRTSMWHPLLTGATPGSGRTSPRAARSRAGSPSRAGTDALTQVCLGLGDVPAGYRAIVQLLARPLPAASRSAARRVRRFGGAAPGPGHLGRSILSLLQIVGSVLRETIGLLASGPSAPRTNRTGDHRSAESEDPVTRQQHRDAAAKASAELVEICVRVSVMGPNRKRCRERSWELANALRAVITAQGTDTIRLPHAEETITKRARSNWRAVGPSLSSRPGHRRGWFVATDTEIGALARLPHHPAFYRFETARAPHLPAPTEIPRMRLPEDDHTPDLASAATSPAPIPPAVVATGDLGSQDGPDDQPDQPEDDWWDEDFPELAGYADGADPEDGWSYDEGTDPEVGYRGEAA